MPEFSDDFLFYLRLSWTLSMLVISSLLIFLAVRGAQRHARGQVNPLLAERRAMSLDEFYREFYASRDYPRLVVAEVVTRFAAAARVPAGLLRPEDSFQELKVTSSEDCEDFAIKAAMMLRDAERRLNTSLFEGRLVTLDDYIRAYVTVHRFENGAAVRQSSL